MRRSAILTAALVLLAALSPALPAQAPRSSPPLPPAEAAAVSTVLDAFHTAAARADEEAYSPC